MCGIFGIISSENSSVSHSFFKDSLSSLAILSESRGKDSSGICIQNGEAHSLQVLKGPIPISKLLQKSESKVLLKSSLVSKQNATLAFGHARLVTNGTQLTADNNQPVIKDGLVGVHNGIITNVDQLWDDRAELNRQYAIDTEVMLSMIRSELTSGVALPSAIAKMMCQIEGTVAAAVAFNDLNKFALFTNNGSLYSLKGDNEILLFASERYILEKFTSDFNHSVDTSFSLSQVKPNTGLVIDFENWSVEEFALIPPEGNVNKGETFISHKMSIDVNSIDPDKEQLSAVMDLNQIHLSLGALEESKILEYPLEKIRLLRRCSKCLLPETFPFIEYGENGECNYCKGYKRMDQKATIDDLARLIEPYRKKGNEPDVLIPISGGRDSTYVLHLVKDELGMNPVTYTYDWGMVTDLARRNVARICGKLGVENIIVAANLHWKRENIKKNISAWLNNPDLGMIPLFMAGDKYFFYYAHKIKKQLQIDLEIWGVNRLENTDFKTGFAGLEPQFDKKRIYSLSLQNQLRLFQFVGKNVIKSPGYLNQSILDSLGSFASRYFTPKKDYFHLFDYFRWDEKVIEETIITKYDWEKAVDTDSTWRIGDGTASFYNYIYTLVAGFSENDTFRSNQIREGMISREAALELVEVENRPRYNSLKWYLEIVGLDYRDAFLTINNIPRLY